MTAADNFLTVVITSPTPTDGEAERITRLIDSGAADFVHLRRPEASEAEMRKLIGSLPPRIYSRLKLHSHFGLAKEYGLGGVHLNSRWPEAPQGIRAVSVSCHSVEELGEGNIFAYRTLSPVFDSISKPGYSASFSLKNLEREKLPKGVIALGGVRPEHFTALRQAGFSGAAMLGYIWQEHSPGETDKLIENILQQKRLCSSI